MKKMIITAVLFFSTIAQAQTLEELEQQFETYLEKTNDAITPERYQFAQRIAIMEGRDYSEHELLDWYTELSAAERKALETVHFEYAKGAQQRHPNNPYIHTATCWSALLQNLMSIAERACKRAYEADFVYGPAVANMGHIHYFKGDITSAKTFYRHSLIGTDLSYDWEATLKEDFATLTNIFNAEAQKTLSDFVENEVKQAWYTDYQKLDQIEMDAIEAEDYAKMLSQKQQKQQLISQYFGKDTLTNAYALFNIETFQRKAGVSVDPKPRQHFSQILSQHGISAENSELADYMLNPLKD